VVVAANLAALALSASATAAPAGPLCSAPLGANGSHAVRSLAPADVKSRAKTIHQAIFAMAQSGKSFQQMVQPLWNQYGVEMHAQPDAPAADPLTVGDTSSTINVSNTTPAFSRDSCTGIYYASAGWAFNTTNAIISDTGACGGCDVGGLDAFGMAFSHTVTISGEDAEMWGKSTGGHYPVVQMQLAYNNNYGDIYQAQDRFNGNYGGSTGDYNIWHGTMTVDLTAGSMTCPISVRSSYGHTWSSTSINSFSIGKSSIGFGWESSGHQWQATSHAGIYC